MTTRHHNFLHLYQNRAPLEAELTKEINAGYVEWSDSLDYLQAKCGDLVPSTSSFC